jgi:hypothetical protein
VPEDQELEPEAGVRPVAIDDGLEEQTESGPAGGKASSLTAEAGGSSEFR